jgi:hypothetical protein
MRRKIIFTLGYFTVMVVCFNIIDSTYGYLHSRAWSVLLFIALGLGWISKWLEHWLVNTYAFFGVLVLIL